MDSRPNIVLVMTDQQRAGFTAGSGFPMDTMPFTDALAARGTRFTQGYTPNPTCAPARTSLLTGRFPKVHGVRQNSATEHARYDEDLLDVLRAAGYSLHLAGKTHMYRGEKDFDSFNAPYWHVSGPGERTEAEQDFDAWLDDLDHGVAAEPTPHPLESQLPYRIVSDAIEAVDERPGRDDDQPFFMWLSFPEPHNPYQVPEPYFSLFAEDELPDRVAGPEAARAKGGDWAWLQRLIEAKRPGYDDQWRRYRANYCGMLRLIDDQVRRFAEHLEAAGLAENTLFIGVADHGDYVGEYGLQRKGAGLPEVLVRIPYWISGPGVRAQHDDTSLVSLVDLLPTLCELTGQEIPLGVQGRSLAPLLAGEAFPAGEFAEMYAEVGFGGIPYGPEDRPELHFPYGGPTFDELNSVTMSGHTKMLRRGRHKLTCDSEGRIELYDLEADPAELTDLAADPDHAGVRAELAEALLRWTIRTDDDLPQAAYTPRRAAHNWRTTTA
ncbi:sulfatase-like hydrolase/transferase [Streptomyces boninensis]|uniref:sulfatase-like hydrolase/transferase n=1 Tax=Streptomyces boninensis TaxID=2039455 RepID=UPI003B215500